MWVENNIKLLFLYGCSGWMSGAEIVGDSPGVGAILFIVGSLFALLSATCFILLIRVGQDFFVTEHLFQRMVLFVSTCVKCSNFLRARMLAFIDATASSCPERRRTSDHRRSTARPHNARPALRQLHWLPVRQRVQFKLAVLVFKALHGLAPQCLTDDCQLVSAAGRRQLRSSDAVTCVVPRTRTCLGDRAFGVADHVCGTLCRSASVSLTSPLDSSNGL